VRRIGESRMPEKAWRYDDGDAGGSAPLEAEPPPPRKLAKEVVGNESATGPELASVPPKLPGVEVIAGEEGWRLPETERKTRRRERSSRAGRAYRKDGDLETDRLRPI
jgi:hypothetical protein